VGSQNSVILIPKYAQNYCPTFDYDNETGGLEVWVVAKQAYISVHVLSEKAKWIVIRMILDSGHPWQLQSRRASI
jgi:hypothetical protein